LATASEKLDRHRAEQTKNEAIPMSVQAMKAGAVEFLTKPFRDQVLLDAIHQVDGPEVDKENLHSSEPEWAVDSEILYGEVRRMPPPSR
jgi:FixJ family two-component response regulator